MSEIERIFLSYLIYGLISTSCIAVLWRLLNPDGVSEFVDFLGLPSEVNSEDNNMLVDAAKVIITWPLQIIELVFALNSMKKCESLRIRTYNVYLKRFYPRYYKYRFQKLYEIEEKS